MSILKINNLNLGFDLEQGFCQVLYDVSLDLKQGKTLALVGESGSGKSLTAMSVLKLLPKNAKITSGQIFFKDKNILDFSEKDLQNLRGNKIALIPQDPMSSLNPLYTIENQLLEVINLHQNLYGAQAQKMALEVLEKVKIPNAKERLKSYPHEFSGGMKQRVIIAMALATNAEIIIADEPTTALDVTVQAQIMKLLKEIKQNFGTSMILITHDLGLVAENADEVAVMYAGRIVEFSKNLSIFDNPTHPYTQALLKALPDVNSATLEIIAGQPPHISEKITGCKFHPRCSRKIDVCNSQIPLLEQVGENSYVACFNHS